MVSLNYDTLDNLPGEMLTDIRALADHFLMALPKSTSISGTVAGRKTVC